MQSPREPSMEDILASIKRVIAEEKELRAAIPPEAGEGPVGPDVGVLEGVVHAVAIAAEEAGGEAPEALVVAAQHLGEGVPGAVQDAVDERSVRDVPFGRRAIQDVHQYSRTGVPIDAAPVAHSMSMAALDTRAHPCEAGWPGMLAAPCTACPPLK